MHSNRIYMTLPLAAALIGFNAAGAMAEDGDWTTRDGKPAAILKIPKGLVYTPIVNRLDQTSLPDRIALEVLPYRPAPDHVNINPGTPLAPSSYPDIAKPLAEKPAPEPPVPDAETQTLAPLIP